MHSPHPRPRRTPRCLNTNGRCRRRGYFIAQVHADNPGYPEFHLTYAKLGHQPCFRCANTWTEPVTFRFTRGKVLTDTVTVVDGHAEAIIPTGDQLSMVDEHD